MKKGENKERDCRHAAFFNGKEEDMKYNKEKLRIERLMEGKLLDEKQTDVLQEAICFGFDDREIRLMLDHYEHEEMELILHDLLNGFSLADIQTYANHKYTYEQMQQIHSAMLQARREDCDISYLLDPGLTSHQMYEIRLSLLLEPGILRIMADRKFRPGQLRQLRKAGELGLTTEEFKVLATPAFTEAQMLQLRNAYAKGLSRQQVAMIADPRMDVDTMYRNVRMLVNRKRRGLLCERG